MNPDLNPIEIREHGDEVIVMDKHIEITMSSSDYELLDNIAKKYGLHVKMLLAIILRKQKDIKMGKKVATKKALLEIINYYTSEGGNDLWYGSKN